MNMLLTNSKIYPLTTKITNTIKRIYVLTVRNSKQYLIQFKLTYDKG